MWYGSVHLPTAVCEVFARTAAAVDVCRGWRATLVMASAGSRLVDLTSETVTSALGTLRSLGDSITIGYADTRSWARYLHGHADGLQYYSARHRVEPGGDRVGVNVAMSTPAHVGTAQTTVRLHDDAIWPHVAGVLSQVSVAYRQVSRCNRCA